MQANVKRYFEDYPNSNQCFETSDNLIFHQDGDAMFHAKSLDEKGIELHLRGGVTDVENTTVIPVIDTITVHKDTAAPLSGSNTVAPENIQPAVTQEVADQLLVATKATGEAVTDTVDLVDTPPEEKQIADAAITETVITASGETASNSAVVTPVTAKSAKTKAKTGR